MRDAFSGSGGLRRRRRFSSGTPETFSPSYGVRHGYRADEERSLPPNVQNQRRWRRVPMAFQVEIDGARRRVTGDVSAGGVLFLFPEQTRSRECTVFVRDPEDGTELTVKGFVVSTERRGRRFAYHVQFEEPDKRVGKVVNARIRERAKEKENEK